MEKSLVKWAPGQKFVYWIHTNNTMMDRIYITTATKKHKSPICITGPLLEVLALINFNLSMNK